MRRGHLANITAVSIIVAASVFSGFVSYKAVDYLFPEAVDNLTGQIVSFADPDIAEDPTRTIEYIPGTPVAELEPQVVEDIPETPAPVEATEYTPETVEEPTSSVSDEELDAMAEAIAQSIIDEMERKKAEDAAGVSAETPEYTIDRETEDLMYILSNEYMDAGYVYNINPYDITDDEAYNSFKASVVPQLGEPKRTTEWDPYIDISTGLNGSEYEALLVNYIDCVDHDFLNRMFADGWRIRLVGTIDEGTEDYETITTAGITYLDEGIIEINYEYIDVSTIHEIGHVLAEKYGLLNMVVGAGYNAYDAKGLNEVYCHNAGDSCYANFNLREKLADLFEDYYFTPREFEAQAPELYGIYTQALNNF